MDSELEARLRLTADKQEIYDVIVRYCRAIDRRDANLLASCFHPDALDDHHGTPIPTSEFLAILVADRWQAARTSDMHFIGNVLIEVEGDVAYSEAYCIGYLTLAPMEQGMLWVGGPEYYSPPVSAKAYHRSLGLRYIDRFERRNGKWKIAYRFVVEDWHRVDPAPDPPIPSGLGRKGSRSLGDAVYTFRWGGGIPPKESK